jgi:hypothetical protein
MPDSDPSAHVLDVPGARLYYERRGTGPLLRAAPTRIVVAAGAASKGQLPNRTAAALADRLGTTVADFPGDHVGFIVYPEQFGRVPRQVLTETPSR